MSAIQSQTTPGLDATSFEILNVMADDCENLEQIYRGVCYELIAPAKAGSDMQYRSVPDAPSLWEIVEHLRDLIARDYVVAVMDEEGRPWTQVGDPSSLWRAWFAMTDAGRAEWDHWAKQDLENP